MANLVSESQEIATAQRIWRGAAAEAGRKNIAIDPPGERFDQIRRVFSDLLAVAHRQHLPWEIHLLRDPMPNAMTPGGGMVFVFEGIFTDYPGGKGFLQPRDDELAAVLAHEIAHVTLMHIAERETSKLFTDRHQDDPFYSASYSTADEAEADKLSVLYAALAGYDPMAASRVWREAHSRYGSRPGRYLYTHPLNADRIRLTEKAASQVQQYYSPLERNASWAMVLRDNPLFPKTAPARRKPGAGFLKAVGAGAAAAIQHRAAKKEAKERERAATRASGSQTRQVRLLKTKIDPGRRKLIWMQFQNGAPHDVTAVGVRVTYMSGQRAVAQDQNCGGPAKIPTGRTVWLSCQYHKVHGADSYRVEITGVQFQ